MRKKKILVHGTPDSLQRFFSDAVSRDFDIVAILSEENISVELDDEKIDVIAPQALSKFVYGLIDGIVITDAFTSKGLVKVFLKRGVAPHKIILWDAAQGWGKS